MSDKKNNQEYAGEYKVEISDKGRIRLDLNYKWFVGIAISILGFVFYLIIDKYHIQPLEKLKAENIKLADKDKSMENSLKNLVENQKILLDRSERVELWMVNNMPVFDNNGNANANKVLDVESNEPGSEELDTTTDGPGLDSTENPEDFQ